MTPEPPRPFRLGWYGDEGLGETLIQSILSGAKTATAAPVYDPVEGTVGETLRLVDKGGKVRGLVRITSIELRRFGDFDETLARKLGHTLERLRALISFANSRHIGPEEEMRVTTFELLK